MPIEPTENKGDLTGQRSFPVGERTMKNTLINELLNNFNELPEDKKHQVIAYINQLKNSAPTGASGQDLLKLAGTLEKNDAAEMKAAIEEGCEQVDPHGW